MPVSQSSPVLSIITPAFNAEKFIADCIESVAAQNCPAIEHLVIDGASEDRTAAIIREKSQRHRHLRFLSEPDHGQSDAMNKGIRMARAEYVSILNVDDFYEPGVLGEIVRVIEGLHEPRFIVGGCNVLTEGDKIWFVKRPRVLKIENILADADGEWPYPWNPSSYFYPKSLHDVVGYYDVQEHLAMDLRFILAAIQTIEPLYRDEILGNFRCIPGTKTFRSMGDGTGRKRRRKIFLEHFIRLPFASKVRVGSLWTVRRAKRRYWNLRKELRRHYSPTI